MSQEKKILTLHPQGKKGVNISQEKYDQVSQFILATLKKEGIMTFQDLMETGIDELTPTFEGKVGWYIVTIKLDLEARGKIERIPKTSPHKLKLSKG